MFKTGNVSKGTHDSTNCQIQRRVLGRFLKLRSKKKHPTKVANINLFIKMALDMAIRQSLFGANFLFVAFEERILLFCIQI